MAEGRRRAIPTFPRRIEVTAVEHHTDRPVPDPVVELYKQSVDRSLLRENLKRSPDERVRNLMALQRMAEELRRAGREARR